MGKRVPHVSEDKGTGRLFYRRAFPEPLRPFLATPRRELKVPLGARGQLTASAMREWDSANRQFERELAEAKAAQRLAEQRETGRFEPLTSDLIEYLTGLVRREDYDVLEHVRWVARPVAEKRQARRRLVEATREDLAEALELRALGDIEGLTNLWSDEARSLAATEGYNLSDTDPAFPRYIRAYHDAQIENWKAILASDAGENISAPIVPPRPPQGHAPPSSQKTGETFEAVVEALLENKSKPIAAATKEATRTALRFFRETHGTPEPQAISRRMVADWLDLLARRPSKVPRVEADLPLPELVALYSERDDVPRLSAKTVLQHVSSLAARWTQAGKRGRIDQDAANPFKGHDAARPTRRAEPKGFSPAELQAIFSLPIFTAGERPRGGKGEASYWLPLLLLYTGARPEEIAQLIVSDFHQDPQGRWMLSITNQGAHPHKPIRKIKTDAKGTGERTFPVPSPLIDLGLLAYLEDLKRAGDVALFPKLRTKGERGLLYAGFGLWWSGYLKDKGVHLEGTDRQPMRELRHTWSTAARQSGIPREAMAYIQGHSLKDATAGEGYGALSPLGYAIDKITFEGFDRSHLQPWIKS